MDPGDPLDANSRVMNKTAVGSASPIHVVKPYSLLGRLLNIKINERTGIEAEHSAAPHINNMDGTPEKDVNMAVNATAAATDAAMGALAGFSALWPK